MKKIIIIISHFILVFALIIGIGCIPKKQNTSNKGFDGVLEEGVTIKVLENDIAREQGYFKELLEAFNEAYAEYGIEAVDANMDESSDLINDGPYGYGPDVLYQANDLIMTYVDGRHILPISKDLINDSELINENAWKAFARTIDGTDYNFAIPVNVQTPLLYYRKDLLDQYLPNWRTELDDNKDGICDIFQNMNDMYAFAKDFNEKNPGKYAFVCATNESYFMMGYLFSYGAYVFGDNDTNPDDIGVSSGEAYKGLNIIRQLSGVMPEGVTDGSIVQPAYGNLAKGIYFSTVSTPDVYTMFVTQLQNEFGKDVNVDDYLGAVTLPSLPVSGDLTEENPELTDHVTMGGVHGYCISSYTESPDASLAFVNFATNYDMIKRRNELLGISPARTDVAEAVGGLSEIVNKELEDGNIYIMPSISAVKQLWTPMSSLFIDMSTDAFREIKGQAVKYAKQFERVAALEKAAKQIYDAIHTLQ